jgi:hypothetical protein
MAVIAPNAFAGFWLAKAVVDEIMIFNSKTRHWGASYIFCVRVLHQGARNQVYDLEIVPRQPLFQDMLSMWHWR